MIINQIIDNLVNSFDFGFCAAINILTYMVIRLIDSKRKTNLTTWQKRIVLLASILILSVIYYFIHQDLRLLVNSAILAPVSWSWIFKPICKKFNADYKKFNIED